jgi:hypothetical protein
MCNRCRHVANPRQRRGRPHEEVAHRLHHRAQPFCWPSLRGQRRLRKVGRRQKTRWRRAHWPHQKMRTRIGCRSGLGRQPGVHRFSRQQEAGWRRAQQPHQEVQHGREEGHGTGCCTRQKVSLLHAMEKGASAPFLSAQRLAMCASHRQEERKRNLRRWAQCPAGGLAVGWPCSNGLDRRSCA